MKCEAIHCFDRATVRFAFYPESFDGPRILGEIAADALQDLFGAEGGPESLLEACQANFDVIEAMAVERYSRSPGHAVFLETDDFSCTLG
ncbi:hypothetical protein QTI24_18905 [Variovorax sp. J22P240]|uniref:hypothetical protein n=1 Tax=Variovorax sp. J22P240 TaxID=3053514 RepID=UPI0025782B83|nr:hypothetical protein [Variovorax sp. J22P240]MDM0000692.1 hypothetical protein [Variovorax sp. J22P240]